MSSEFLFGHNGMCSINDHSEVAAVVTIILPVSVMHICRGGPSVLATTARLLTIKKERKTK